MIPVPMHTLPSLDTFKAQIITLVGSLVMLVLIVRIVMCWIQKRWGEMVGELAAVIFIGWIVWFPDNAQATLTEIIKTIFG